jgi:hypothetical protein
MDLTSAMWRKSAYSGCQRRQLRRGGDEPPGGIAVRDSKDPDGAVLVFTPYEWDAPLRGARHGVDLP